MFALTELSAHLTTIRPEDLDDPAGRAILADWLAENGRDDEAALCRGEADLCVVGGVVWDACLAASHLNKLHRQAEPLHARGHSCSHDYCSYGLCASRAGGRPDVICSVGHSVTEIGDAAAAACLAIARRYRAEARRQLVREAAQTKTTSPVSCTATQFSDLRREYVGSRMLVLADAEIRQWIAADDARRLAEYEAFRAAVCGEDATRETPPASRRRKKAASQEGQ